MSCIACVLEGKKIKAKNAPSHTCAKSHKDYQDPEVRINKDNSKSYRIEIYDVKVNTTLSTLFRLQHQFLNGYNVKRFTDLWVPHDQCTTLENYGRRKSIWMNENFYKKLVFL